MKVKFNKKSGKEWKLGDVIVAGKDLAAGIIIQNSNGDYCAIRISSLDSSINFSAIEINCLNCEAYDSMACLQDKLEPQGYHVVPAILNVDVDSDFKNC